MRIISGRLGGRNLKTVEGEGYRPAMGKTREALFSMLAARGIDWYSARVLDLFAGSGSLAFEAISRGAEHALLVEMAPQAVRCLKANIAALKQYLDSAQPIAALAGTQTAGQAPAGLDQHGLSADERAVAAACGMTPEQYASGRAAA